MRKVAMEMMEGEGKRLKRGIAESERVQRMYEEEMRRQARKAGREERKGRVEKGGISRADLPSCGEMADHHRRVIREPNTLSYLGY